MAVATSWQSRAVVQLVPMDAAKPEIRDDLAVAATAAIVIGPAGEAVIRRLGDGGACRGESDGHAEWAPACARRAFGWCAGRTWSWPAAMS